MFGALASTISSQFVTIYKLKKYRQGKSAVMRGTFHTNSQVNDINIRHNYGNNTWIVVIRLAVLPKHYTAQLEGQTKGEDSNQAMISKARKHDEFAGSFFLGSFFASCHFSYYICADLYFGTAF